MILTTSHHYALQFRARPNDRWAGYNSHDTGLRLTEAEIRTDLALVCARHPLYEFRVVKELRETTVVRFDVPSVESQLLTALQALFDAGLAACMKADGKYDQLAALKQARAALKRAKASK